MEIKETADGKFVVGFENEGRLGGRFQRFFKTREAAEAYIQEEKEEQAKLDAAIERAIKETK